MSIFVDRGKVENLEKISSEQGREPTILKRKEIMTLGPGFTVAHKYHGKSINLISTIK